MSRAAYMREYRKRRKVRPQLERLAETYATGSKILRAADPVDEMAKLLAEAQEEIRRLKRELAARPERNPYTEFRPVPKHGHK